MEDYNKQYFYIKRDGNPDYPILDYSPREDNMMFLGERFVKYENPVELYCIKPLPKKMVMADYLPLSYPETVVSKKMKEVLENINLKDVQFQPVVIGTKKKEFVSSYFIFHVYHTILCADLEKSEWEKSTISDRVLSFDKLVLDNDKLAAIPLEERLIFAVEEKETYILYHESVVKKILQEGLSGFTVYRLSKWDPSDPFWDEYFARLES